MIAYGKNRFDLVLQPISGKAVPVHRGEVIRITQVEGETPYRRNNLEEDLS